MTEPTRRTARQRELSVLAPRRVLIPEIVSDVPRRWFAFEPAIDQTAGGGADRYRSCDAQTVGSLIDVYG